MSEMTTTEGSGKESSVRRAQLSTGVAGLAFAVLYQVGSSGLVSLPGAPTGTESDDDLARYFANYSRGVLIFAVLVIISTAFLVWFAYGFRRCLLTIDPSRAATPGELVVGAGVAAAAIILCALFAGGERG